MSLTITRVGRHQLKTSAGVVISSHTDLKEAYESASRQANGSYTLDMAGFCAFVVKAKVALGASPALVVQRLAEMKTTATRSFENWTRTANWLPKYRISPVRKFNWWTRGMYELVKNEG